MSVRSTEINNLKDKSITTLTFIKEVNIFQEDINQLNESVSILIPYISNAYEIYFNGQKIVEDGKVENDQFVRNGFRETWFKKFQRLY